MSGFDPLGRRSTGENENCYRFEHLAESFSTECPSLPRDARGDRADRGDEMLYRKNRYRGGLATLACICLIAIAGAIASATADATVRGQLVPPTERGPYNVGTTLFTATMSG